ncbi:trafficking protein particle complex subunit 8-like isoform X2 [Artemia franciscana]|uniref:trafficking protein particle complex subunit 8-like isoform X2 n=1 Tax=Artemia franciscana TaxID=6661 RepID=UPI0032DBB62E
MDSDLKYFVHRSFPAHIATLVSPDVDSLVKKNNLTFNETLLPFSEVTIEGRRNFICPAYFGILRDQSGHELKVNSLNLCFQELNHKLQPPVIVRKMLSNVVASQQQSAHMVGISIGKKQIEVPKTQPWYTQWKELFLNLQEVYDHEFIRHYLACIFVVSTSNSNPLSQFESLSKVLSQQTVEASQPVGLVYQSSSQSIKLDGHKTPKIFSSSIPRYYLLLHDAMEGDISKAEDVFKKMVYTYGAPNCHLLVINSKQTSYQDDGNHTQDLWMSHLPKKLNIVMEPEASEGVVDTSIPISIEEGEPVIGESQEAELLDAMREPSPGGKLRPSQSELSLTSLSGMSAVNSPQGTNSILYGQVSSPNMGRSMIFGTKNDSQYGSSGSLTSVQGLGPLAASEDLEKDHSILIHGSCLTAEDRQRIQTFVNEFYLKCLLPFIEGQMKSLYQTAMNRKNAQTSIFSATRRFFGSTKTKQGILPGTGVYQFDSPPLQVRRLADLAFMLGHYDLAYECYHTAKRDFESDQAWIYFAGALEMAALSVALHNIANPSATKPVPFRYFDTAFNTYSNIAKHRVLGIRSGILWYETLSQAKEFEEAAKTCIRLTGEDSDLMCALILEQAAHCFLRTISPSILEKAVLPSYPCRYAFHLILSGHRFTKAGQRRHAARVYLEALRVYEENGWIHGENHIYVALGKHMQYLKQLDKTVAYLSKVFGLNRQRSVACQMSVLRDFVSAGEASQREGLVSKAIELPIPIIDQKKVRVSIGLNQEISEDTDVLLATGIDVNSDDALHQRWLKLEESVICQARGKTVSLFKPKARLLTEKTNNTNKPVCTCQEPITFSIPVENHWKIPLSLQNLYLLWKFKPLSCEVLMSNEDEFGSEDSQLVTTQLIEVVEMAPEAKMKVILSLTPLEPGELIVTGLAYTLVSKSSDGAIVNSMQGRKIFTQMVGPRLNSTPVERKSIIYAKDFRLNYVVEPIMPRLRMSFQNVPDFLLCGEVKQISVKIENIGKTSAKNICVAYSDPKFIWFEGTLVDNLWGTKLNIPNNCDSLVPGASAVLNAWIRATDESGLMEFDLLFYFEEEIEGNSRSPRYSLINHTFQILLNDSLMMSGKAYRRPVELKDNEYTDSLSVALRLTSRHLSSEGLGFLSIDDVNVLNDEWEATLIRDAELLPDLKPFQEAVMNITCAATRPVEPVNDIETNDDGCIDVLNIMAQRCMISSQSSSDQNLVNDEIAYGKKLKKLLDGALDARLPICVKWKAYVNSDEDTATKQTVFGIHFIYIQTLNKIYRIPASVAIVPSSQTKETKILNFVTFDENGEVIKGDDQRLLATLESEISRCICYRLDYKSPVCHDFSKSRLCLVPVKIVVFNSFRKEVDVRVAAMDPRLPPRNQLYHPEAMTPFSWVGTSQTWRTLQPRSITELNWTLCASMPGTYCLDNRLKIDCRITFDGEEKPRVFGQVLKFDFELLVTSP